VVGRIFLSSCIEGLDGEWSSSPAQVRDSPPKNLRQTSNWPPVKKPDSSTQSCTTLSERYSTSEPGAKLGVSIVDTGILSTVKTTSFLCRQVFGLQGWFVIVPGAPVFDSRFFVECSSEARYWEVKPGSGSSAGGYLSLRRVAEQNGLTWRLITTTM